MPVEEVENGAEREDESGGDREELGWGAKICCQGRCESVEPDKSTSDDSSTE